MIWNISKIVEVSIQEEEDTTINFTTSSLGPLDHARMKLEEHRGREYRDRLVNSATIEGYYAQVWEDKVLHVSEQTRHVAYAGIALTTFLAALTMPKWVAIAIAIPTAVVGTIEYVTSTTTIIKYNANSYFYRDGVVNGLTTYEVQRRMIGEVISANNRYEYVYKFADNDPDFYYSERIMNIAVSNYKLFAF